MNSYPIALGSKQTYSLKDNLYATGDFHLMTRIVLELLPTQCDSNVSPSLGPPTLKEKKIRRMDVTDTLQINIICAPIPI